MQDDLLDNTFQAPAQAESNKKRRSLVLHCKDCANLNFLLSTTIAELKTSAQVGCTFCNLILKGIEAFLSESDAQVSIQAGIQADYGCDIPPLAQTSADKMFHPQVDPNILIVGLTIGSEATLFYLEIYSPETPNGNSKAKRSSSPWKHMRSATSISGATASATAFAQAQRWLRACERSHEQCPPQVSKTFPGRILDISHGKVRLRREIKTDKYACLSHCWGG